MKQFADLYARLDATTSSNAKLAALKEYFGQAPPADAAWAVFFLAGGRPRQLVPTKLLRALALYGSGVPEWLFEESYQAVGDLAETIALLLPESEHTSEDGLALWMEDKLLPQRGLPPEELLARLLPLLGELDRQSKLVCIKLITGSFRVGVSKLLVTRALAALSGMDPKQVAQRLVGYTDLAAKPNAADFERLISPVTKHTGERSDGHPYPFFLAHPLQIPLENFEDQLGPPSDWLVEWKWDGIRGQLVKRGSQLWVWSRGEELVTERFPELSVLASCLPDGTVIDGEIVVWKDNHIQPFALLQQRIGRRTLTSKVLENAPVAVLAYDLLEWQGQDWRARPQAERRAQLEQAVADCSQPVLTLSPLLVGRDWLELARQREASRSLGVEGMMLKARNAHYGVGRTKDVGVWWKWKIDPYTVDAVLIYAQRGHGRRASLYTDFTFAVWDAEQGTPGRKLVPFAKAYSGLTDEEMHQVDAIIRKTTVEKFGPVRSVTPTLVFELGFEGIALSSRHKSGIAVRFPRMLRWRQDKPLEEADTLATLKALLPAETIAAA
ncbi:MAG TPA: ATP-dependent DNA ligase [Methylophilaceae bacterium]|nr:ATP-dependent DNA ligase [Methylophilaceae bacterium]